MTTMARLARRSSRAHATRASSCEPPSLVCVALWPQVLLALVATVSGASMESLATVEHCVSSRWGYTCLSQAGKAIRGRNVIGGLSAGQLRKFGARGVMVSAGLFFGREVLRDTMALPGLLASGDVARATLAGAVGPQQEKEADVGRDAEQAADAAGGDAGADGADNRSDPPPSRSDLL